ncbi:nuclear protein 96-domain-containing protein [Dendryphion nanum]|uniref:Nuclear protein 96-domain-containing protein n=1 Tax=Dendryphion nanum TaxID=256645 RepID=A0A9P9EF56_9PLEO|nr:nuclear protein 96-domain-containing protein [Dendryphion nanum]
MSFGSGGGFGFGSNSNSTSTFGGFGANNNNNNNNNNTTGGFGTNNNNSTPFGQSQGGNLFGGNANNSSPFGGTGGGFGSNNNNTTFGSKPFGASGTGNLFGGSGTSGSTFGGFGSTTANNNTSGGFGGGGNTLFGQNKPLGFGTANAGTGNTLFGGSGTSGFGGNNTASTFGGATGGFGQGNASNQANNGTAGTPFTAFQEKDTSAAGGTQHYQTITFLQPYQNYSLEELRVADYNQGRRYGNQNGQAGAFGQNTGFGGFGANNNTTGTSFGASNNTGGGLFGNNTSTSTGFGQNNSTGAFGANNNNNNTGGGLFGGNKPGGLFGGTPSTQAAGGSIFGGTSGNTTGAFGGGTGTGTGGFGTTPSNTGGGLFGSSQAQTQNKPFGGFGTNNTATTNSAFGGTSNSFGQSNTTTGGGLFGGGQNQASSTPTFGSTPAAGNTGGGLFGGGSGGGGLFGQNNQNQTQPQTGGGLFGGGGGGGAFGQTTQQNQPKPGGLFGNTAAAPSTTGGGLFGQSNAQPQQASGGLFGNSTSNNTATGGLFGNKPAATGGLFGGTSQNTGTASTGLFGGLNNQNQPQPGGSGLFSSQQNQPKPGGLFGNSTSNPTGGGLFGNLGQNTNPAPALGGSLFGSQNQSQQQQAQQPGSSLFGASGTSLLTTSMNTNPYGNDNLFAGLATPTQSPGPLATPLSSSQKLKKSAVLPQHKLNPAASNRLLTPQNKKIGGYGFTYSTYGTPSSASSNSSPSFSNSFIGGSLTRSLGKSLSTSNLRNSYTPDTSILAPGAFSTNRAFPGGSLKKLNISRTMHTRDSLFSEPPQKVRFAKDNVGARTDEVNTGGSTGKELMLIKDAASAADVIPSEATPAVNGDARVDAHSRPGNQQVNGQDLTPVPENGDATPRPRNPPAGKSADPQPGEYYSRPSMEELRKMNKNQLRTIENFMVGREEVGKIEFNPGGIVDLSEVDLSKLYGHIVQLNPRNATVYGANSGVVKPARGSQLNHPSRITLANSWPRNRAGKKDTKHLERLRRVEGTTFENYIPETGEWIFRVPHFSSYGLDYEGEQYSDDDDDDEQSSPLSEVPATPAQLGSSQMSSTPQDDSPVSHTQSSPDDTFDFKKGKRSRASVPGGFGGEAAYEEEEDADETMGTNDESFLGERSVGSLDGQVDADYTEESESESVEDQDMADSVSELAQTTEQSLAKPIDLMRDSIKPKSILKNSQLLRPTLGTPSKGRFTFDDDWANQLQRTISPKKQDRQALRESQGNTLRGHNLNTTVFEQSLKTSTIPTHMELLEGLWEGADTSKSVPKRVGNGIELPYSKRPKTSNDLDELSADDRDFHSCNKPRFSQNGMLVYTAKGSKSLETGFYPTILDPLVGANKDVRVTKLPTFPDAITETLNLQKEHTKVSLLNEAPFAKISVVNAGIDFLELSKGTALDSATGNHEHKTWELLSILFDDEAFTPNDLSTGLARKHQDRIRKDRLSEFWMSLVAEDAEKQASEVKTPEEKALALLSGHNVADACHALLSGFDIKLATIISQIGGDQTMRANLSTQLDEWRRLNVLSETDDSVRALYELASGNCAQSKGKIGAGREEKLSVLNIAQHFKLDWRRAFGLRLWYGILSDEPIEMAVAQYADALRDGLEKVKPIPWFVEQDTSLKDTEKVADDREDILWGILKLYASSKMDVPANVEDVLAPENVSGDALNARLSFQLYQIFKSRLDDPEEHDSRKIGMPTIRPGDGPRTSFMSSTASLYERDRQAEDPLIELGDQLTLTYAASLQTPEHWTTSVWVYAHLSSAAMRDYYIRSTLSQFSHTFNIEEGDKAYEYLSKTLRVPESWLHSAAALQAKTVGDSVAQVTHLIKAGELEEAHEVLCRSVGPDSIISRNFDRLRELLGEFVPTPPGSPIEDSRSTSTRTRFSHKKEPVQGWSRGGQIYFDYIHLLDLASNQSSYRVDEELNDQIHSLLSKLQHSLETVAREKWEGAGLEERVALTEISGVVAGLIAKNKHAERSRVLKLPLTEDLWLRHSNDLSVNYYRSVIMSGK